MIEPRKGYGYQDLLLVPQKSELDSRQDPSLESKLNGFTLRIPVFSAPMDTVTESDMAVFMADQGGMGVIHRYNTIEEQVREVDKTFDGGLVGASTGVNGDAFDRAKALVAAGVDLITIDVAHGHTKAALRHIERIRSLDVTVMSGNLATPEAALDALKAGARLLRVGIGAGSACTTRLVAGVGVPQLTAISDIRDAIGDQAALVADGGIKTSGDIIKALAAGADAVMIGGLLARYPVAPRPGEFRGMASRSALVSYKGTNAVTPEGETFETDLIEDYESHFETLISTVKQGFAYLGASNLRQLRDNARWIEVSNLGFQEGEAHFK